MKDLIIGLRVPTDVRDFLLWTEATPKSLMRAMGIAGLTLYHLKSHLQAIFMLQIATVITVTDTNWKS